MQVLVNRLLAAARPLVELTLDSVPDELAKLPACVVQERRVIEEITDEEGDMLQQRWGLQVAVLTKESDGFASHEQKYAPIRTAIEAAGFRIHPRGYPRTFQTLIGSDACIATEATFTAIV